MKRKFCSLVLFVVAFSASADISGRIVRVLDGDTVEVLEPGNQLKRIRLAGIDAPEKSQPFGQRLLRVSRAKIWSGRLQPWVG